MSADCVLQMAPRYRGVVSDELPQVPAQLLAYDLPVPVSTLSFPGFENLENMSYDVMYFYTVDSQLSGGGLTGVNLV
jgi:hypothetical protein